MKGVTDMTIQVFPRPDATQHSAYFETEDDALEATTCVLKSWLTGRLINGDDLGEGKWAQKEKQRVYAERCFMYDGNAEKCDNAFTYASAASKVVTCKAVYSTEQVKCMWTDTLYKTEMKTKCQDIKKKSECNPHYYTFLESKQLHYACKWDVSSGGMWECMPNPSKFVIPAADDVQGTDKADKKPELNQMTSTSADGARVFWATSSPLEKVGMVGSALLFVLSQSPVPKMAQF